MRSLSLRPGGSLTIPKMALSMGFRSSVSLLPAIQATGLLAVAPKGLTPSERVSLCWTHQLDGGVQGPVAAAGHPPEVARSAADPALTPSSSAPEGKASPFLGFFDRRQPKCKKRAVRSTHQGSAGTPWRCPHRSEAKGALAMNANRTMRANRRWAGRHRSHT